jgi:pyruvate dehydrogenase E1 component
LRDANIGQRVVPIIPDEARTFGMDGLFKEVKIYAPFGQKYTPVDSDLALSYQESQSGQILEEGITESGAMASFTAAGTAYSTHGQPMVPMYIFYSMFGFQRTGDLAWAFGDARGRGFMFGATAGRTTLNGEGLQHEDGHSLVLASTIPNIATYDPAFAYELAAIIADGLVRMYGPEPDDVFYYVTLYNENYVMPAQPTGVTQDDIVRGLYPFSEVRSTTDSSLNATILFSGTAYSAASEAAQILAADFGVSTTLFSATSYKSLREEALSIERWNRLHPLDVARVPYVTQVLDADAQGPIVAVSDFMKSVPEQIARFVPEGSDRFTVLGTDGYGRSDTRNALRRHFETDAAHVVVAVLSALQREGAMTSEIVAKAIARFGIDADAIDPLHA